MCRFNHRLTRPAPDTTPAATFVARLFMFFATAVTLGGRHRRPAFQACLGLPSEHRFQSVWTDFGGQNTEAAPLPALAKRTPGSAIVSATTDWQGLDAPFIVELFMFRSFCGYPDGVSVRLLGVATGRLPTPACVRRT